MTCDLRMFVTTDEEGARTGTLAISGIEVGNKNGARASNLGFQMEA